jgi:glycosyltransferase involved in cell wall biosynthesis
VKVVVGANSLSGPLTGIGHYTLNLVEGLAHSQEIEELRLLSHGRLSAPLRVPPGPRSDEQPGSSESAGTFLGGLRVRAAKNRLLVNLYDAVTARLSARALRDFGPNDIFHSPDFQFAAFPGKTVVTIPDLSTITFPQFHPTSRVSYINRHIGRVVECADHIVAISDFVRDEIKTTLGVETGRISTIYPGIDPGFSPVSAEAFKAAAVHPNLDYKNYFLFVSTIEPRKNLGRLLAAYQRYAEGVRQTALPLVIVGLPGWNSEAIHAELNRLVQTGQVIYPGYVTRSNLRTLLAGARALLFPSVYEGFGLPVIEAMKSGTAVLTSSNSAMSEISVGAALLVSPMDIEDMTRGIAQLHCDQALVESLVDAGFRAGGQYSWERCARETVELYTSLISRQ